MTDEPKRSDIVATDLLNHRQHDVLEVRVVLTSPNTTGREGRGEHEAMFGNVIDQRKVVTLPVAIRAAAVETQDEGHLLAWLQIARIVEEIGASGFCFDHRSAVGHQGARAVRTIATKCGRRVAWSTSNSNCLGSRAALNPGLALGRSAHAHDRHGEKAEKRKASECTRHSAALMRNANCST